MDTFKEIMKEGAGLYQQAGSITLVNRANTAKVFINWFLSREGQLTLQKAAAKVLGSAPDSLRVDIPKERVLLEDRRQDGITYMDMDTPERIDIKPVVQLFSDALTRAGKK